MKKILYPTLCLAGMLSLAACDDFLETSSPSNVDSDFVFSNPVYARAALSGAYSQWNTTANGYTYGAGLFYAADIISSDIERRPEAFGDQEGRDYGPESFYVNGTKSATYTLTSYQSDALDNSTKIAKNAYANLYSCIGKCVLIMSSMEQSSEFETLITNGTEPSSFSEIYGEAVALWATCYRELLKFYGDVPYSSPEFEPNGLTSRDYIYDKILERLQLVEPLMYPVGSVPDTDGETMLPKSNFSQTYVDGLIGRIALEAGGFQTRRLDLGSDFYVNGKGEVISFENKLNPLNEAQYCRRSDWKDFYVMAKTYFGKAIEHAGTASFTVADPRVAESGREYGNPYQYFFQQMMDGDDSFADESIYEYPRQQGVDSDERTYSSGRPSSGGSKDAYPCKSYGQCRINPAFYYGIFDPNDKRRDVAVTITGSKGSGVEIIIPFTPGNVCKGGGFACNKWDENRMASPWVTKQRQSGINGPYMRMSEIYLGYAEACAVTGDDATAKEYLNKIRSRAFDAPETDAFISSCASLYPNSDWSNLVKAIIEERGFEFAGEGDRRMVLIRTGVIADAIKRIKTLTGDMMDGLKNKGYYAFDNGNVISDTIYTKAVDAKTLKGHRLTAQHMTDDDPVLYPGWRGQNDDWATYGWSASTENTNLAIEGLFKMLSDTEVSALEADGYVATGWGGSLLENYDEYYTNLYPKYDFESTPLYLYNFTPSMIESSNITNGYGLKNE